MEDYKYKDDPDCRMDVKFDPSVQVYLDELSIRYATLNEVREVFANVASSNFIENKADALRVLKQACIEIKRNGIRLTKD